MKKLILFVIEQAELHGANRVELLGDLFHNHNMIRLEVIEFWTWALQLLAKTKETVVLVGNHDISNNRGDNFSSLSTFGIMNIPNLTIVEKPTISDVFGYISYTHDIPEFIARAKLLTMSGAKVLVCHQTIEGSKYESGMYAPDGVPTGEWSERFTHIISGHIHSEQSFGNVIYPGTARWDSIVDANRRKGIVLYEHDDSGQILSTQFISTENVCSPIRSYEYREGSTCPTWEPNARVAVELIGSSAWIASEKEKLKGKCSIKTKVTDKQKNAIRKTGNSFEHFIKELFPSHLNKADLLRFAKEIGIV